MTKEQLDFFIKMEGLSELFVKEMNDQTDRVGLELKWIPNPTQEDLDINFKRAFLEGYVYAKHGGGE